MKKVYPVILTPAERGYVATVPDLQINSEGNDIADAMVMAREAIGLWGICEEDVGRTIPEPSKLPLSHAADEIVTLVDVDFSTYRKANDNRTVRTNVTLPSWLKDVAEKEGVNFSQVLQEALKEKLNL